MFKKSILFHNRYRKFVSFAHLDYIFLYSTRYFEISLTRKIAENSDHRINIVTVNFANKNIV
jgi:hypothetical protein